MKILSVILVVFGMSAAHAEDGYTFGMSLNRTSDKTTGTTLSTWDLTNQGFDIKFGYNWSEFHLGALYSSFVQTSSSGSTSTTNHNRTGYGLTVGYHKEGFIADLHYMPMVTDARPLGADLTGGSGIGVDLGYNVMLGSSFFMGFEFSYRSFSFSTLKTSGADVAEANTWVQMYPQINLGFNF